MFITALFTIAMLWKQTRCPTTDEWDKKMSHLCTMEYYSDIRNNDMWFEGKWMQLKDIMSSNLIQAQKHKGCMFSLIHKVRSKDKYIHKNKHDHIQIQM
jgi:hypothetical protein